VLFFSCCGSVATLPVVSPRKMVHMQAGQCDSQMGTKFWKVVCDEHGIGGGGEYCGDNDGCAARTILRVLPWTLGGKCAPHAVLMDLGPGVIGAAALSRRSASSSARKPRESKKHISRPHQPTPSALYTAPTTREVLVV
jgi:hypothetical protein